MREVGWVIFDEIHYMRDKERGVVWEETLILLPHNVHFVFLSATIPNARQFAEWVAHLHVQPCHVVYTDYRPTPLQHFIYPAGGSGIHMVVDETVRFFLSNTCSCLLVLNFANRRPCIDLFIECIFFRALLKMTVTMLLCQFYKPQEMLQKVMKKVEEEE